jgi:hypothetical protein
MDLIDRGGKAPRLPGPYGLFLRGYERERGDLVSLAFEHDIALRMDGAISGNGVGDIHLIPIDPKEATGELKTSWGQVALCLALCPELMEVISLRLWLSSASGRDVYRNLLSNPDSSLCLTGGFRWLPPGDVTPGTAEVEGAQTSQGWQDAPYLKATADDLNDIPHTLDFRFAMLNGLGRLIHLRSFVVVREGSGSGFIVPGCLRSRPVQVEFVNPGVMQACRPGIPAMVLAYLQPGEDIWTAWKVSETDAATALSHGIAWAAHRRSLVGLNVTDEVIGACRLALGAVDLVVDAIPETPDMRRSFADPAIAAFALSTASRILLGAR